jgi:hypothetical protein
VRGFVGPREARQRARVELADRGVAAAAAQPVREQPRRALEIVRRQQRLRLARGRARVVASAARRGGQPAAEESGSGEQQPGRDADARGPAHRPAAPLALTRS